MNIRKLFVAMGLGAVLAAGANDSSYNGYGAFLTPAVETDISVKKEVLTITLNDEGYSIVDVQYTFYNSGAPKTITMGFETDTYCSGNGAAVRGGNPNMTDFTNVFNGSPLPYTVQLVMTDEFKEYLAANPDEVILEDCDDGATYTYSFTASFPTGESTLHQRFKLLNSNSVSTPYIIDYKLTPATRWAGGTIGDFTLVIDVPNTAKYFSLIGDQRLQKATWTSPNGKKGVNWKSRFNPKCKMTNGAEQVSPEFAVRNAKVEVHLTDYAPKEELTIYAVGQNYYGFDGTELPFGLGYDRNCWRPEIWDTELFKVNGKETFLGRVLRNMPYAHRGYVFKDPKLRNYFSQLFWYMPDPSYVPNTSDFTSSEQYYIKGKYWED